jgi:crotonobetainyl-CoA:carnitine CoA-transferase CaiB-like acyl-CoA transferase
MEPLEGIRIVELTTNVAAPMGTMILADQGADVIRIEPVDGADPARAVGAIRNGVTSYYLSLNRNKRAIAIDLKDPRSRPLMEELLRSADVFVHNTRPGVVERLNYGYEDVHALNPNLIYASLTGFGPDGPAAKRRVYDLVIQGVSGMARSQSGENGPEMVKNIVCDKVAAVTAAQAISSALFARERGKVAGHHVELTMLEANLSFLWPDGFWNNSFVGDFEERPLLSDFISTLQTNDGHITMFVVGDNEFEGACAVFKCPELLEDPRFITVADRFGNGQALMDEFKKHTLNFATDELVAQMEEAQVPCAKINDFDDVINDPRITHRGSIIEYDHPVGGRVRQPRPPAIFGDEPCRIRLPAPAKGEHTGEVFSELGLSADALAKLHNEGVLGLG